MQQHWEYHFTTTHIWKQLFRLYRCLFQISDCVFVLFFLKYIEEKRSSPLFGE